VKVQDPREWFIDSVEFNDALDAYKANVLYTCNNCGDSYDSPVDLCCGECMKCRGADENENWLDRPDPVKVQIDASRLTEGGQA